MTNARQSVRDCAFHKAASVGVTDMNDITLSSG